MQAQSVIADVRAVAFHENNCACTPFRSPSLRAAYYSYWLLPNQALHPAGAEGFGLQRGFLQGAGSGARALFGFAPF